MLNLDPGIEIPQFTQRLFWCLFFMRTCLFRNLFGYFGRIWPAPCQILACIYNQSKTIWESHQQHKTFQLPQHPDDWDKFNIWLPDLKFQNDRVTVTCFLNNDSLYITLYVDIKLLFCWPGFKISPAPQSIVITYFYRIHHHRFNDSTALPYICHFRNVTFKQPCLDPCFELLHSLSSHDPILNPHQSCKSLGPDFQSLMRGFAKWKASGEGCAPSSPSSWSSCVLVGTCQRCNSEYIHEYADGRPKPCRTCLHHVSASQKLLNCLHPKSIVKTDLKEAYSHKWSNIYIPGKPDY